MTTSNPSPHRRAATGRPLRAALLLLLCVVPAALAALTQPGRQPGVTAAAGVTCQPGISLTTVPAYGSFADLQGAATCVTPADYAVAVYIYVAGWWTKPSFAAPLTPLNADLTWSTDITTGGVDETAIEIAAFLVPGDFTPPLLAGDAPLPESLFDNAVAYTHASRSRRSLTFAGRSWHVKYADYAQGPGPNRFSDDEQDVWVDEAGRLHLRIAQRDGQWYSTEVFTHAPLGYGTYTFAVEGAIDDLNENVVLGLFTWDGVAPAATHNREIDVAEISRWSDPDNPENAQYVVQPWYLPGNLHRYQLALNQSLSTHTATWQPDVITFATYAGDAQTGTLLQSWSLAGDAVLPADDGNARINLWLNNGVPPSDGQAVEVIISDFTFLPAAVHVATTGSDTATCGAPSAPCATIQHALDKAPDGGAVRVAEGVYPGTLTVSKTVELLGGYSPDTWERAVGAHPTVIDGAFAGSAVTVRDGSTAHIAGFTVRNGLAAYGGGILVDGAAPTISHTIIRDNAAAVAGGGVYIAGGTPTLTNTVIRDNGAAAGSGLYVQDAVVTLLHNTLTANLDGDGRGVYAEAAVVVAHNVIVADQVVGVYAGDSAEITLTGILWHANQADIGGDGSVTVFNPVTGNPAFAPDGYHLTLPSAAIDAGTAAGVDDDVDGAARDASPDLGADEWAGETLCLSVAAPQDVGGLTLQPADIACHHTGSGSWLRIFDGAAHGLSTAAIDAFLLYGDDQIVLSFAAPTTVPGVGTVDDSDLVLFNPATGTFIWAFDGSDVGLTTDDEDIDAVTIIDNKLAVSTSGALAVAGLTAEDEDFIVLANATFGPATSGTWQLLFDGSDVGLGNDDNRDLNAAWFDSPGQATGKLYAVPVGTFTLAGLVVGSADIAVCHLTTSGTTTTCDRRTSGLFWRGAAAGLTESITALTVQLPGTTSSLQLPALDAAARR